MTVRTDASSQQRAGHESAIAGEVPALPGSTRDRDPADPLSGRPRPPVERAEEPAGRRAELERGPDRRRPGPTEPPGPAVRLRGSRPQLGRDHSPIAPRGTED